MSNYERVAHEPRHLTFEIRVPSRALSDPEHGGHVEQYLGSILSTAEGNGIDVWNLTWTAEVLTAGYSSLAELLSRKESVTVSVQIAESPNRSLMYRALLACDFLDSSAARASRNLHNQTINFSGRVWANSLPDRWPITVVSSEDLKVFLKLSPQQSEELFQYMSDEDFIAWHIFPDRSPEIELLSRAASFVEAAKKDAIGKKDLPEYPVSSYTVMPLNATHYIDSGKWMWDAP